jgi:hypothetical protein
MSSPDSSPNSPNAPTMEASPSTEIFPDIAPTSMESSTSSPSGKDIVETPEAIASLPPTVLSSLTTTTISPTMNFTAGASTTPTSMPTITVTTVAPIPFQNSTPSSLLTTPATSPPTIINPTAVPTYNASPTDIPTYGYIPTLKPISKAPSTPMPQEMETRIPTAMTSSPKYVPISEPGRSMAPHKMSVSEESGELEQEALEKLTPVEVFAITVAVLTFVCLLGFCCGRRFTLWCLSFKRRRGRHQPNADESAPFSAVENDML